MKSKILNIFNILRLFFVKNNRFNTLNFSLVRLLRGKFLNRTRKVTKNIAILGTGDFLVRFDLEKISNRTRNQRIFKWVFCNTMFLVRFRFFVILNRTRN